MSRILIVAVIAFLYSSPALAVEESLVSDKFKFTLATCHEDGFYGAMPITWIGKYRLLKNGNATIEEVKKVKQTTYIRVLPDPESTRS